jgi:uncharacterized protein (DUF58 family)
MKLYPTRTSFHLAAAGGAVMALGLISGQPAVVGWGAAVIVGVAVARAATLVSVARIRAAGFEMLWSSQQRTARLSRGGEVLIEAEVRNRDTLAARYIGLRAIASSQLDVTLEPSEGEVPASGKLKVTVRVRGPRVGRHGLFGLSLEVRGAPGLFEVPLTFANPFGVEVRPASFSAHLATARGGRTRLAASGGEAGRSAGEGSDLREVREHRSGDSFRRIAWRASAKRGKLMVREMEHEERDIVWVLVDASCELWAGPAGLAPLDLLIDEAASVVDRHVRRGDKVGLAILGARVLRVIDPAQGPAHGAKLHAALAFDTGTYDRDRSDMDEADVAARVVEHLRPIDPAGLVDVSRRDLDKLAQRAQAAVARAPFQPALPEGATVRERRLRQYLAACGSESPARAEPEHARTCAAMAAQVERLRKLRPRPSLVYVAAPLPGPGSAALIDSIRKLSHGTAVRWVAPRFEPALEALSTGRPEAAVLLRAMLTRSRLSHERGARVLRRVGVLVERPRVIRRPTLAAAPEGSP